MLKLGLTKDAPGAKWCKIWEIEQELYEYEAEVFPKYKNCFPFKLSQVQHRTAIPSAGVA